MTQASPRRTTAPPASVHSPRVLGRIAARALWHELTLHPKPGLVSLEDAGAHADMDARTFVRSLFALRPHFGHLAAAGARDAPFATLRELGIRAEAAMLAATGGVNTHRGAIFALGLLVAAAARTQAGGEPLSDASLRVAAGYAASDAIESVLKPVVGRHRPSDGGGPWRFRPFQNDADWHSFPSRCARRDARCNIRRASPP